MREIRRYLFWIGYDGSKFPEMAKGGTGFGVMDLLNQTVSTSLFGFRNERKPEQQECLKLSPSSRTDAKVHAIRNSVICQIPLEYSELDKTPEIKADYMKKWKSTIDAANPGSLVIRDVHSVSAGFCIRRSVSYRKYTYRLAVCRSWELWESIRQEPSIACFSERDYAWRLPPGFSPERLLTAGRRFEGEQVMGSFFKHTNREKRFEPITPSALKYILHVGLSNGEAYSINNDIYDYYNVTIVAKSFVREQIRRMMSCLVNYSYDRIPLATVDWLLNNPISSNFFDMGIPIAPPQGLFLTDVVYDPNMFTKPVPYYLHSWDYE
ncbi:hypothetical protein GCK72_013675 [Caenorhabditis remanei]|nr:hypothetical protein GCK72_013675 [Caenorhabditis remanei]KAF1757220.1 hypothetical protein GCK72_013675 [Caenorhabditis remanei]